MTKKIIAVSLLLFFTITAFGQKNTAEISGNLSFLNDGDTVILRVFKYGGLIDYDPLSAKVVTYVSNHSFHLKTELKECLYFGLSFSGKQNEEIYNFILSPGDNINITGEKRDYNFSGTNSASFIIQATLKKKEQKIEELLPLSFKPGNLMQYFSVTDSAAKVSLALLDKYKSQLNTELFDKLKSSIEYGIQWFRAESFYNYGRQYIDSANNPFEKPYQDYLSRLTKPHDANMISADVKASSPFYCNWVYRQYEVDSCVLKKRKFSVHKCFLYYMENFDGLVREELITRLFIVYKNHTQEDISSDIAAALSYMKDEELKKVLKKIEASNITGATAYDFSLTGLDGKTIKLDAFRGKVVVLDFWFTGCGACRLLAPELLLLEKKYEGKDVAFLSICTDKYSEQWRSSVLSQAYSSPLSINLFTEGKSQSHPVVTNFGVVAYPTLIVIDKNGKIGKSTDQFGHNAVVQLDDLIAKYLVK